MNYATPFVFKPLFPLGKGRLKLFITPEVRHKMNPGLCGLCIKGHFVIACEVVLL